MAREIKNVTLKAASTDPGGVAGIDMNNQRLPNVGDPVQPKDAVTKAYFDKKFGELSGALVFRGVLNGSGDAKQLADAKPGWLWVVSVAGTLLGEALKVGDEVYCKTTVTGTPTNFNNFETIPSQQGVLRTTDVVNNLTSTVTDKPLSANMGKTLNEGKININDVINNLTSTETQKPLSAKQGKDLEDKKLDKTSVVNSLTSTATDQPGAAAQLKLLNETKADKAVINTRSYFNTIISSPAQYLYVGQIEGFFSTNDNIAVFDIYGRSDFDTDEIQQAHYALILRKSGYYTDRLFIDYHEIKGATGGNAKSFNQARAYYKADGTVKLYLNCSGAINYGTAFVVAQLKNGTFTEAMTFSGTFSPPAGFTDWTTGGWLTAR